MSFSPHFWTSVVGSFPHSRAQDLCERLAAGLDVPDWPQLPRRDFRENMYTQYSAVLPGLKTDLDRQKIFFDTSGDISSALECFYERYLAEDIEAFALPPEYAEGFYHMLNVLAGQPGEWCKGQVTGPVSFGLTVTDQDLRASLYDEALQDVIVKNIAMSARWQARELLEVRPNAFIFLDEPYMASFGSAFISLSREAVIAMLDEVIEALHTEGALAGVHCCGNTDWSVLMATQVDILNLDAYGYLENLALYPAELAAFLDRGGTIAWGLVPNNENVFQVTAESLARRLVEGIELICVKAKGRGVELDPSQFDDRSLVVPSCGLGSTSVEVAEKALSMVQEVGRILQETG